MPYFRSLVRTVLIIVFLLYITGCAPSASGSSSTAAGSKTELLVSAAASLSDALKEIQSLYEQKNPGIKLTFNLGSSGTLQQQIEQGAPADVFLSAGAKQMDALTDKGLVDPKHRTTLLSGELVLIIPADSPVPIAVSADLSRPDVRRIAVGEPGSVPAGMYAKAAMEHDHVWNALQPKIVLAKDVRQVLTYVETGNADAGFVYKTDALGSQKIKVAMTVDPASHPPIEYPAGMVLASKHPKEAERFYTFLQSKEASEVFTKYGFMLPQS